MKPILIDVSKFGGEAVLSDLQELVDQAYSQGYKDGARKYVSDTKERAFEAPLVSFNGATMAIGEPDWLEDET